MNKITSRIGNSFYINYGSVNIRDVISTAIDSLDIDGNLHIGMIAAYGWYICIGQKATKDYACGLAFGYGVNKVFFQIKSNGAWQTIREI